MPSVITTSSADLSVDSLDDCVLGERRRNEDDRHIRAGFVHSLGY